MCGPCLRGFLPGARQTPRTRPPPGSGSAAGRVSMVFLHVRTEGPASYEPIPCPAHAIGPSRAYHDAPPVSITPARGFALPDQAGAHSSLDAAPGPFTGASKTRRRLASAVHAACAWSAAPVRRGPRRSVMCAFPARSPGHYCARAPYTPPSLAAILRSWASFPRPCLLPSPRLPYPRLRGGSWTLPRILLGPAPRSLRARPAEGYLSAEARARAIASVGCRG